MPEITFHSFASLQQDLVLALLAPQRFVQVRDHFVAQVQVEGEPLAHITVLVGEGALVEVCVELVGIVAEEQEVQDGVVARGELAPDLSEQLLRQTFAGLEVVQPEDRQTGDDVFVIVHRLAEEELARDGTEVLGDQFAEGLVRHADEPAAVLGTDAEAAGHLLGEVGLEAASELFAELAFHPGLQLILERSGEQQREIGGFAGAEALGDGEDDFLEEIGIGQLLLCRGGADGVHQQVFDVLLGSLEALGRGHLEIGGRLVLEVSGLLFGVGNNGCRLAVGIREDAVSFFTSAGDQEFSFFFAFGEAFVVELLREFL